MTTDSYKPTEIEPKWATKWFQERVYRADDKSEKPKSYLLIEFPYPSGERLHVGHARSYSCLDALARKRRMQGLNVMFPFGWDAFGLPAENYAIKTGVHPSITTAKNIANAKSQAVSWGLSFDWDREVNTTDPEYYKWTQWIFVQLFKHGLAYKQEIAVNWCPSCKINLANEEVIEGKCERCGTETERRKQSQWLLAITKYADRLARDLSTVNFREDIAAQQVNWIGKKEGAKVNFKVNSSEQTLEAFTTRIDTLFGVTFVVVAPEMMKGLTEMVLEAKRAEVEAYVAKALKKSERERKQKEEKTGVDTGVRVINPANGEEVPVWVAEYVMMDVGTGVVMGVPAHDERDYEFARKNKLPIRQVVKISGEIHAIVIKRSVGDTFASEIEKKGGYVMDYEGWGYGVVVPGGAEKEFVTLIQSQLVSNSWYVHTDGTFAGVIFKEKTFTYAENEAAKQYARELKIPEEQIDWDRRDAYMFCYEGEGKVVNSGKYDDMLSNEARETMLNDGLGEKTNHYHLRDWVFSRQHYWGEPIPMIFCEKCGWMPVPEEQLPVKLPEVEKYQPTETGESPLAHIDSFVKTTCPKCGGEARRETDTMPNWAGSSWYYLRYIDPHNAKEIGDPEKLKYWLPVDWYNGGMEHTTLHLLYSRFWHKFLFDIGIVPTAEPYAKRTSHGMVLGPDGRKMSKSRGNVINPDEIVGKYGADTLRMYEMFIGPFDQMVAWSEASLEGVYRFLKRVWREVNLIKGEARESSGEAKYLMGQLTKTIDSNLETGKFNTAVSAMMEFFNWWQDHKSAVGADIVVAYVKTLAPMAPFIAEELYQRLTDSSDKSSFKSVHLAVWPEISVGDGGAGRKVTVVVQVNGKVRDRLEVTAEEATDESAVEQLAQASEKVKTYLNEAKFRHVFVPGKLINFVVS